MDNLSIIINVIGNPFFSIKEVQKAEHVWLSNIVVFLSIFSINVSIHIISGKTFSPVGLSVSIISIMISGFMLWLTVTSFCHLIAEINGGRGSVTVLLSLLGFSLVPTLLLLPVSLIVVFFGYHPGIVYAAFFCVVVVWVFLLAARSIASHYSLRMLNSCIILLSPLYIIPLIGVAILFALIFIALIIVF